MFRPHLEQAYAALERNDLSMAETLCRQALEASPLAGEPLHLLGIAARRRNRPAEAAALLREAWRRCPEQPEIANNLAALLCASGLYGQALEAADAGLIRHPDFAYLHANRGVALHGLNRPEEAATAFRRALSLPPQLKTAREMAQFGLATSLESLGHPAQAESAARALLSGHPDHAEGLHLLGRVLAAQDKHEEAAATLRRAIDLLPPDGAVLARAWNNLATALLKQNRPDQALEAARHAVELDPGNIQALNTVAIVYQELMRLDEAIAHSRQAVALEPDNIDAHWCLGLQLLHAGQWAEGWSEYEWRWRLPFHRMMEGPPVWSGQFLGGNALLVTCEQGQGDSLQFLRYVPRLTAYSRNLILRVQTSLERLAANSLPGVRVIGYDDPIPPVPFQVPLMSLPGILGCPDADAIPHPPYLRADPRAIEEWRQSWPGLPGTRRIGLAWRGSPSHKRDHLRSIGLEALEPLLGRSDCRFVALHPDIRDEEKPWLEEFSIAAPLPGGADFADSAALVENLDLIISVDSAAAHLAGALDRPTWVMLPFSCDWRWGRDCDHSPWYPSLRLFRQPTAGDWWSVTGAINRALDASA